MLIINPFYATSSTEGFLDNGEFTVVCPLLETSGHKVLYKSFSTHRLQRALLQFQLNNDLNVGSWIVTETHTSVIFSVGLGRDMDEHEISNCVSQFKIHLNLSGKKEAYIPVELSKLPGVEQLKAGLEPMVKLSYLSIAELRKMDGHKVRS